MIVIVRCCNDELAQQLEPYISALGAASLSQATQVVIQFLEESVLMASSVGWPSQRSDFCMQGLAKSSSCTSSCGIWRALNGLSSGTGGTSCLSCSAARAW